MPTYAYLCLQGCSDFRNITLRNVVIDSPLLSPGVILGNDTNPMEVLFDNVTVRNPGPWPYNSTYDVRGTYGVCVPPCDPLPPGFMVQARE